MVSFSCSRSTLGRSLFAQFYLFAVRIEEFIPICLLNVIFRIFTLVGTNRLTDIAHTVVRPTQTTFMPRRHIQEGMVVLHETVHELHPKKLDGVIFKVDFEKAYDKVK